MDMAVGYHRIEVAIEIGIEKLGPEFQEGDAGPPQAAAHAGLAKIQFAAVQEKDIRLLLKVGNEHRWQARAIDIPDCDPHARH